MGHKGCQVYVKQMVESPITSDGGIFCPSSVPSLIRKHWRFHLLASLCADMITQCEIQDPEWAGRRRNSKQDVDYTGEPLLIRSNLPPRFFLHFSLRKVFCQSTLWYVMKNQKHYLSYSSLFCPGHLTSTSVEGKVKNDKMKSFYPESAYIGPSWRIDDHLSELKGILQASLTDSGNYTCAVPGKLFLFLF